MKARHLIPVMAICCSVLSAQSTADESDPKETQTVLRYLLAASNMVVPPNSFCSGNYGQHGAARVLDVLSMHLAYFGQGQNRINGKTNIVGGVKHCELKITRLNGEDVSNGTFRFTVKDETLVPESLQCFMTP